ncbi:hypothetical protein FRIG_03715 [Frigoribacterium faeni]|uniref:hypothetical protein n=1 Tax=Frigoribacterium faeni TaxID=145483 RepID=UPI001FAC8E46|nr:hypothetical protein [Frigoribacterium faeni]MCJ0700248.1 hypothetical protein [Frigoribacterium faeni]
MDDPIDWSVIREDRFNQVVEALLVREYSNETRGRRAMAINGRGGDGGIDVGVWNIATDTVEEIFQLKHFLDGWPKRVKGRQNQIAGSFDRAWKNHRPSKWVLVTPSNPTIGERQFVMTLGKDKKVDIDIFGPAELDGLLGDHPEVLERFTIDRGRKLLRDIGRPEWALNQPGDLTTVMGQIHRQVSKRSDHWASLVTMDENGNITEELKALTENAAEAEPLEIKVTTEFTNETKGVGEAYEDALRHGLTESVTLRDEMLKEVRFVGPEWFAEDYAGGELTLLPGNNGAGSPATITSRAPDGVRLGGLSGTVENIAVGTDSGRIVANFPGGLQTRWTMPRDQAAAGEIRTETSFAGHRVRDVGRVIRFLSSLNKAGQLTLEIDGKTYAVALHPGSGFEENARFVAFLEDLVTLENELDVEFRLPDREIEFDEWIWVRIARRVLQGVAVPYPKVDGFNFTLNGQQGTIEEALERQKSAFLIQQTEFVIDLLGTEVHLGHVFIVQSYGTFLNGPEHAAALQAGEGEGRVVQLRAVDNLPFIIYAPERLQPGPVVTTGWGIDGLNEHPKLEALRELQRGRTKDLPDANQMRLD